MTLITQQYKSRQTDTDLHLSASFVTVVTCDFSVDHLFQLSTKTVTS